MDAKREREKTQRKELKELGRFCGRENIERKKLKLNLMKICRKY